MQFGTGDVLFLSDSGARSLKAQYINLAASVSDVGFVDRSPLLIPVIRSFSLRRSFVATRWCSRSRERYWVGINDTIYVLSYFPAGNITAWSTFDPGFIVRNLTSVDNMVFCSDTVQNIYLYGGVTRVEYDSCLVTVRTPHMNAGDPTQSKRIKSIGVMCQGQWSVSIGMLPNNTEAFELAATIQDNTYGF